MKSRFIRILPITLSGIQFTACTGQSAELSLYTPGLGEIMTQSAARHVKLWYAGQAQNWDLAAYEIDELKEGFEDAGKYHPSHKHIKQALPELLANYMNPPLEQLEQAIKARNQAMFRQSFDTLTTACNACHQATEFGFNQVQRPNFNPYSNQAFDETQN